MVACWYALRFLFLFWHDSQPDSRFCCGATRFAGRHPHLEDAFGAFGSGLAETHTVPQTLQIQLSTPWRKVCSPGLHSFAEGALARFTQIRFASLGARDSHGVEDARPASRRRAN